MLTFKTFFVDFLSTKILHLLQKSCKTPNSTYSKKGAKSILRILTLNFQFSCCSTVSCPMKFSMKEDYSNYKNYRRNFIKVIRRIANRNRSNCWPNFVDFRAKPQAFFRASARAAARSLNLREIYKKN